MEYGDCKIYKADMEMDKKTDRKIVLWAITCITILEIAALIQGVNGTLLTIIVGVIAGLAGLSLPQPKIIKELR